MVTLFPIFTLWEPDQSQSQKRDTGYEAIKLTRAQNCHHHLEKTGASSFERAGTGKFNGFPELHTTLPGLQRQWPVNLCLHLNKTRCHISSLKKKLNLALQLFSSKYILHRGVLVYKYKLVPV